VHYFIMTAEHDSEVQDYDSIDFDVSTPQSQVDSEHSSPSKKKRKAWGQPIPEFEKIIGPRKRAKTDAEKTQRAHERTLRNRRAAAHSRDKKQAQFAAMEIENQELREQIAAYQARFGALSDQTTASSAPAKAAIPSTNINSYPTPSSDATFHQDFCVADLAASPPTISISGPVLSHDVPDFTQSGLSPTLAPTLHLDPNPVPEDLLYHQAPSSAMTGDLPDATQYSAAVLLDPQCQASVESTSLIPRPESTNSFNLNFQLINLTILMTIFENFSSSMLTPMYQIFRTLAGEFSMHSVRPEVLDQHFQLIHCLIMSPMKGTARPVFRMKLLSRLLACNPITARLITVAADRALQRQVTEGSSLEDPESCQRWASLLTLRWTIKWLEIEHARYREARRIGSSKVDPTDLNLEIQIKHGRGHQGVDYRAVERSSWRWNSVELPGVPASCDVMSSEQLAH
jgi:transcriptional activator HAC1